MESHGPFRMPIERYIPFLFTLVLVIVERLGDRCCSVISADQKLRTSTTAQPGRERPEAGSWTGYRHRWSPTTRWDWLESLGFSCFHMYACSVTVKRVEDEGFGAGQLCGGSAQGCLGMRYCCLDSGQSIEFLVCSRPPKPTRSVIAKLFNKIKYFVQLFLF